VQKCATFTTILSVKKRHFHYDMQKNKLNNTLKQKFTLKTV
jgi:hypothetical protein